MRITKLQAAGIKGRKFEHELDKMNLIYGDIRTGKTARIDAVLLALTGQTRTHGPKSVKEIFSGKSAFVQVVLDDGATYRREWKIKPSGSCSEVKGAEHGLILSPLLFNPADLCGLSSAKMKERIVDALPEGNQRFNWKKFDAEVGGISIPAKHASLIEEITDEVAELESQSRISDGRIEDFLKSAIESQVDKQKEAIAVERRSRAAIAAEAGIERQPPNRNAAEVLDIQGEQRAALDKATEGFHMATAQEARAASVANARRAKIRLDALTGEELPQLEKQIKALTAQCESIRGTWNGEEQEFSKKRERMVKEQAELEVQIAGKFGEVQFIGANLEKLKSGTCPVCSYDDADHMDTVKAEFTESLEALRAEVEKLKTDRSALAGKIKMVDLETAEGRELCCKQTVGPDADLQTLGGKKLALTQESNRLAGAIEQAGQIEEVDGLESVAVLSQRKSDLAADVEKLGVELEAARDYERPSAAETHKETAATAASEAVIRKDIAKILQVNLDEVMRDSVGGILDNANRLIEPVLDEGLHWQDGIKLGGATLKSLSGSERAIVPAGVACALVCESDFKLLLMDELAAITIEVRAKLFGVIRGMINRGEIDQFIGILPVVKLSDVVEFNTIEIK